MSKHREMNSDEALAFLARAPAMQVAGTDEAGAPLLRTLHGVVVDGAIAFHGGPRGEKSALSGRPVVVAAEEIVARIPSWMRHPERACPATTFYRSVQAHGVLEELQDGEEKARILQALMERFQPEGRHTPITAADPLYAAAVRGLRVTRLRPTRIVGRVKLGSHLGPGERQGVLRGLWQRGEPGDLAAIEAILAENPDTPPIFSLPEGVRVCLCPGPEDARAAAKLLADAYWNLDQTEAQLEAAHLGSGAWIVLRDAAGLLATARAISDRAKRAWIYDVAVRPEARRQGFGKSLLAILLDHPVIRGAELNLGTRDAQGLYASFGFLPRHELPPRPYVTTWMVRARAP